MRSGSGKRCSAAVGPFLCSLSCALKLAEVGILRLFEECGQEARGGVRRAPSRTPQILLVGSGLMLIGAAFVNGGAITGVVVTGLLVALALFVRPLIEPEVRPGAGDGWPGTGGVGAGFIGGSGDGGGGLGGCGGGDGGGGGGGAC